MKIYNNLIHEISSVSFTNNSVISNIDLPFDGEGINLHVAFEKKKYLKTVKGWDKVSHSDKPNCKIIKHKWKDNPLDNNTMYSYFVITIKDIKKGEPITINYNDIPIEIKDKLLNESGNNIWNYIHSTDIKSTNILIDNIIEKSIDFVDEIDMTYSIPIDKNIIKYLDTVIKETYDVLSDNIRFVEGYVDPRPDSDYNTVELKKGIDIETEHVTDKYYSKIIAKDHLDKDPDYYKKLIKMEKENEESGGDDKPKPVLCLDRLNPGYKDPRPDNNYCEFELSIGRCIEFEHTSNYNISTIIAKDHLDELPNYYSLMFEYDLIDMDRDIDNRGQFILSEDCNNIKFKKDNELNNIQIKDLEEESKIMESSINIGDTKLLTESDLNKDKITPIYIILTKTNSIVSKAIQKVTGTEYNHVSISFEPDLSKMYSFGKGDNGKVGFAIESKDNTYLKLYDNVQCKIFVVFINKKQSLKMRSKLDEFISMKDRFKYHYLGLLGYFFKKPITNNFAMFCSEFVDSLFKLVNIDLTGKPSSLVYPFDFDKDNNNLIYKIYDGSMKSYNKSQTKRKVINAYNNYKNKTKNLIKEVKEFPVQFDKEGNLLIKNMKKLDFEHEYSKSHKLLVLYEKNNNYEGIKYELSKLWFMNSILERNIYNIKVNTNKKKDYIKARARILNDFNKYLKVVTKNDKNFNFTKYYEDTPFGDITIKINKDTLTGIGKIIKGIII